MLPAATGAAYTSRSNPWLFFLGVLLTLSGSLSCLSAIEGALPQTTALTGIAGPRLGAVPSEGGAGPGRGGTSLTQVANGLLDSIRSGSDPMGRVGLPLGQRGDSGPPWCQTMEQVLGDCASSPRPADAVAAPTNGDPGAWGSCRQSPLASAGNRAAEDQMAAALFDAADGGAGERLSSLRWESGCHRAGVPRDLRWDLMELAGARHGLWTRRCPCPVYAESDPSVTKR